MEHRKTIHIKNILFKGSFFIFLLLMLLFPTSSLDGAKKGLLLWFHTVLPTLLPFIIISSLIIRLNITHYICKFFYPILGRLFRISKNACYPIIMGYMSGIPLGAKTCSDLVIEKKIGISEGQFLSIMNNNASPMFLLSYIALSELKLPKINLGIIVIIYGSSILTALFVRRFMLKGPNTHSKDTTNSTLCCAQSIENSSVPQQRNSSKIDFTLVDESILDGFEVITKVGGYIILFSIMAQIISSIPQINEFLKIMLVGILEITTGVDAIANSTISTPLKIVLILTITSFGGFSGVAQTKSVFANSGLSIKIYIKAKIINSFITLLLSIIYVSIFLHI